MFPRISRKILQKLLIRNLENSIYRSISESLVSWSSTVSPWTCLFWKALYLEILAPNNMLKIWWNTEIFISSVSACMFTPEHCSVNSILKTRSWNSPQEKLGLNWLVFFYFLCRMTEFDLQVRGAALSPQPKAAVTVSQSEWKKNSTIVQERWPHCVQRRVPRVETTGLFRRDHG